jgi:hypothetical protein
MVSEMTWISFFRSTRGLSADRFGDYAGLPKTHKAFESFCRAHSVSS